MSMLRRSFVLLSLMGLTLAFTVDASACNLLKRLCRGRGICRPVGPGIPGGGLVRESLDARVMLPPEGGFPAAVNERVRVLLVLDDQGAGGWETAMRRNGDWMTFLLGNALPEEVIERNSPSNGLVILRSSRGELTSASVRRAIDRLQVNPTDALFCWWGTHGEGISGEADQDLNLPNDQSKFSRRELFELMRAKSPRLSVLLVDACNGFESDALALEDRVPLADQFGGESVSPLFAELLLRHRGEVGIASASPGELAWAWVFKGQPSYLSCFGLAFQGLGLLEQPEAEREMTWEDTFATIRDTTNEIYQDNRKMEFGNPIINDKQRENRERLERQDTQIPYVFCESLAVPDDAVGSTE